MNYKETLNLPQTPFPMKGNLTQKEPEWVQAWEKEGLYSKIKSSRKENAKYVLHDGPPYANGDIHLGHAFNKILKDIIIKFKTLQGFYAFYVPGWDCHGLPVEHALFKVLGKTKDQVDQVQFRKKAHEYALKYVGIQREQFKRLGIFGEWDDPYLTLSPEYEAEIVGSFIKMYLKGYIYKGLKPIYWCCECETALAEAEVEYDDHESPSVFVSFEFLKVPENLFPGVKNLKALIWTTTPWTLPANLAISVHPEAVYAAVYNGEQNLLMAKDLVAQVAEKAGWKNTEILGECKGKDLEGLATRHPFLDRDSNFILGEHVTLDTGSGCVHTAPGHGQEDYEIGMKYRLDVYSPVNHKGEFDKTLPEFEGLHVFKANEPIVELLQSRKALIFRENIKHSYPHCWRCKNPIIFRATSQWFASMEKHSLRKKSMEQIKKVKWVPAIGENRISSMVEQRPDWCLSRQRLWGVPIPVISCGNCGEVMMDEKTGNFLVDLIRRKGTNIWFAEPAHSLLPEGAVCFSCGEKEFVKDNDIIDVWFDSGVSHQAVLRQRSDLGYPADLYLEGSDQHRGWFQSALLTAVGLNGNAPYKQVLTHGFVVDGEGKKMSKSVGNVISPKDVMKKYGADILRLWVSGADYTGDVRISNEILDQTADAYRKIRNTFKFLLGNLYDFDASKDKLPDSECHELDRWALSRLAHLTAQVTQYFDKQEFYKGYHAIHQFCIVEMSSFYFDILKDRLYTFGKKSFERRSSQTVLAEILSVLVRLVSPILVFTADEVYKCLPQGIAEAEGVHLSRWPSAETSWQDKELDERWKKIFDLREEVLRALEEARKSKLIGNALEAKVLLYSSDAGLEKFLLEERELLSTVLIVSGAEVLSDKSPGLKEAQGMKNFWISVQKAEGEKCSRCWKYRTSVGQIKEHPGLCSDCAEVVLQISGVR